ncbi:MAG: hypothetical protein ACFFCO_05875 [Promethearchaeota archaeon]
MTDNPVNKKLEKLLKEAYEQFMTLSAHCPACDGGILKAVYAEDVGKTFQVTLRCDKEDCFCEAIIKTLPNGEFELVSISNEESAVFFGEFDADD